MHVCDMLLVRVGGESCLRDICIINMRHVWQSYASIN